MAVKYSDATLLAQGANPPGDVKTQDQHGRVRCMTASYTAAAADGATTNIFIGTLPVGARVLSGYCAHDNGPATAVKVNFGGLTSTSAMLGFVSISASGTQSFANVSSMGFLTPDSVGAAGVLSAPADIYMNPAATVSGTPNIKVRIDYVVD